MRGRSDRIVTALRLLDDLFSGIPVIRACINVSYTHAGMKKRVTITTTRDFPCHLSPAKLWIFHWFPDL